LESRSWRGVLDTTFASDLRQNNYLNLKVKYQGPMKVIIVRDTPPYGHASTLQLLLTYLERQKCYGADKKILFKKQLDPVIYVCANLDLHISQ
jgi:hypothetical protein